MRTMDRLRLPRPEVTAAAGGDELHCESRGAAGAAGGGGCCDGGNACKQRSGKQARGIRLKRCPNCPGTGSIAVRSPAGPFFVRSGASGADAAQRHLAGRPCRDADRNGRRGDADRPQGKASRVVLSYDLASASFKRGLTRVDKEGSTVGKGRGEGRPHGCVGQLSFTDSFKKSQLLYLSAGASLLVPSSRCFHRVERDVYRCGSNRPRPVAFGHVVLELTFVAM